MVMISVLVLLGLGLVTATVLAVASRVFHVEEDPRVQAVLEALPGANCGGCGYAGCEGYATAVATDPAVPANRCCAGGAETSIAVGELTGKTVAASDPLVSFRRCDKVAGNVALRYDIRVCLRVRRPPVWWAVRIRAPIRASASGTACRCAPSTPSKCVVALRG
ncbi:MAG: (Fe-S)-binding protein [Bilophila wadsworthia]